MTRRKSKVAWKQDRAWNRNIGAISGIASTELAASETSPSSPAPAFLAQGVNPDHLHLTVAISSGVLDSLPHNGYAVTTIRATCNETHRDAYGAVGALTVIVLGLRLLLCLGLFALGVKGRGLLSAVGQKRTPCG